ncbi:MAG: NAD(P)-binding protein, partial [Gemmatimonadota bacterium]|nr:NAD(P)-binding protein [Gemmatimonadota bacterium]
MSETRQKIAVLGGGPSVMSALYWLTSTQELRDRYDITVYQMGWRLGGKGASGRGKDGRILEHGLHVLFGFYQNFFYMIRHAYAELNRPEGHPLRTWRQAFHPRDFGV